MLPLLITVKENGDGTTVETPLKKVKEYNVAMTNVVGSGAGTTEDGHSIIDIRRVKALISVTFAQLDLSEFEKTTGELGGETVKIKYFCGKYKTSEFQITKREFTLVKAKNETQNYWNASFELEEV